MKQFKVNQKKYNPNEYYEDFAELNEFLKKRQIGPYLSLAESLRYAVQQSDDMVNVWLNFAYKFTDCYFRVSTEKKDFQGIMMAINSFIQILKYKKSPDKIIHLIDQFETEYCKELLGIEDINSEITS